MHAGSLYTAYMYSKKNQFLYDMTLEALKIINCSLGMCACSCNIFGFFFVPIGSRGYCGL